MTEQNKSFAERFASKKSSFSASNQFSTDSKMINSQEAQVSSTSNEANNYQAKKSVDPQKKALGQFIYLVKGVDAGRNAWYYVLVERLKVQLFLKALNDEIIHLEKYGKILYSAYGDEPPASVTQSIKDEYGID